jgi:acyl-CoA thioester hydrolase
MTEWPDVAGRIANGLHYLPVRIYYEDTDFSGAVYHANFIKYCERARSDCLRLINVNQHELGGDYGFVVRRILCDYLKPATIGQLLEVETRFLEAAGARMELRQRILRDDEELFVATITVALVDRQGRPKRLPPEMKAAFGAHAGFEK